jgi:IS4 transposase
MGLRCDQIISLNNRVLRRDSSERLRRIRYVDPDTSKRLVFLTNNTLLPALTIADMYRCRWQVELFFRWIKQHLRIKSFYGTSENAVKTQVWTAISVYLLVAIIKKRLNLNRSLFPILQILSVSLLEKTPIQQALAVFTGEEIEHDYSNQLILFE